MRIALAVVATALLLTACAPTGELEPAPSSASPTASATVEPTETATPEPTDTVPALSTLVLSPEGVGPVVIDQPVDAASTVTVWDDTMCEFDSGDHGGWKPNYPFTADGKYPFLPVPADNAKTGAITYISVQSAEIRTAKGIGIGSTLDELIAAYPNDLIGMEASGAPYVAHVLPGEFSALYFWVDEAHVIQFVDVRNAEVGSSFVYEIGGCS